MKPTRGIAVTGGSYLTLVLLSILVLFPFAWLFFSSFKGNIEILSGNDFFPKSWSFDNYVTIMTEIPMLAFFKNSAIITVLATFGGVFASAMSAFVFAKLVFKGRTCCSCLSWS